MEQTQQQPEYIQVGVAALRDPLTGDFLPAVKLYIQATPAARKSEEKMIHDIGSLFAAKMRQYVRETGKGKQTERKGTK